MSSSTSAASTFTFGLPRISLSQHLLALAVLLLLSSISTTSAQQYCNVCRNAPSGGVRDIAAPKKSFTLSNGKTFTCGQIKASMRDIRVDGSAAPGEKNMCARAQLIVEANCACSGPKIASTASEFKDPNPACSLCGAGKSVPSTKWGDLTNTGSYGMMNCQGLQQALKEGVFPATACSTIKSKSSGTCC